MHFKEADHKCKKALSLSSLENKRNSRQGDNVILQNH